MIRCFLLTVIGIIFLLQGILFVFFPWKMKDWIELFLEKSDNLFRVWGIVILLVGLVCLLVSFLSKFLHFI